MALPLALLTLLVPATSSAQSSSDEVRMERFESRVALFLQEGRGIQSQAEPDESGRGSEEAWIFQPAIYARLRQDRQVTWDITLPVDIVSAASTDALDAVSTASRYNEAGTLDVRTNIEDGDSRYQVRAGAHFEEHYWSAYLGYSSGVSLADDNTQLTTSFLVLVDTFDPINQNGRDRGLAHRITGTINAGFSQLLSPTTILAASYGFTGQMGRLETTYNSVPTPNGGRVGDQLPTTRARHAFSLSLRQALPDTHTFLSGSYRFYIDDHDVLAHTAGITLTQEIGDFWVRGRYRFHNQSAPYYWMARTPLEVSVLDPRTGDSDLEALDSHEAGLSVRWFYDRAGALTARNSFFEIGYTAYFRTNSLFAHVGAIQWGHRI